ncbi:2-amino-4-hydroxy-6-hydroxymethyldihydropteridine diphosphokinase [Photobacterium aphoticum]|uniref:2-amino-4-hydroxy-6-hydroxymethyldihydropteridine diphosphokinase n=1 Tax=Photobacterium aphoticum TaxID=754436 RepID=A0A0J1GFL5_9GAMM|nr:2-amino-4-hydroxy-6-hydroxymethyldihydropteridine diphosphokinase [Photobacterium aphoticum]KLU98502.1 2-amino-4-hydroxy-6-hydroxymethyldihydropteridine pyrophosphokinase [Photobacterium aphoticum]PSU48520.1 2-amino-4-hydroxy-6-hydroxymethyldihydropteridine diphosphokinase [Photobacterium aphoticum]GHA66042.1 2-amino-4-hydroxy-6-hydroxymethyldihydropteridine diphosphokinase [Photobacterium aphoticum]
MITAYISVGSNIERDYHVRAAIAELRLLSEACSVSTIYEAEPVGFEGPNFYNGVIAINTSLSLVTLQATLKQLELQYGRSPSAKKNQSRTLDLDILLYGDCVSDTPAIPRADIFKFAFVLRPLMELCPDRVIPGDGRTVRQVWQAFDREQALWPVEDFVI